MVRLFSMAGANLTAGATLKEGLMPDKPIERLGEPTHWISDWCR